MWYTSEIKELQKLGFSRKYYEKNDKMGFYYSKRVESDFINRLSIAIHFDKVFGKHISVTCYEPIKTKLDKATSSSPFIVVLHTTKYSIAKLHDVINYFEK